MPANRRGLNAGEVLAAAGPPFVSQRQDNCETWFYKGTDTALENRMVVVQLCIGGGQVFGSADDGLDVAQARGKFALLAFARAEAGDVAQMRVQLFQALPAGGGDGKGVFVEVLRPLRQQVAFVEYP